jgi:hypothetical protein
MANNSKYGEKYEDNFGFYELEGDPDERAFFEHVKASSLDVTCERCLEPVRLMPGRAQCARCLEALEFGGAPD